ncbi:MarR family winged helix-turn-helix transcriptional regulator [Paludibacterium paludis]|uniref:Transcriptional regulator n=1 Tax=Paludibacterium paludis TaxID=1225769 RepID=A0A918P6E6_9NEIS|nr:MarR family transcriptional regulator [Paludibacterium paludis]GGY27587.1 transcriptional regulator [Paludibacterium paludis]
MSALPDQFSDLIITLPKMWKTLLDERFKPFNMSSARWQVLFKLGRADEALTQNELALRIGIEPASLVRLIDALEGEGLVVRQPDPDDRRIKRVRLTPEAIELSRELFDIADGLRADILSSVDQGELEVCLNVLKSIRGEVEKRLGSR